MVYLYMSKYILIYKRKEREAMGFLDSFMDGLNSAKQTRENRELIEIYHEFHDCDTDYRKTAFDNTDSNNGWYTCPRCGKKFRKKQMHVDHIVPQSKGGDNSRYNLQVMCPHCNCSKRDSMVDTERDLVRRRQELKWQDEEDLEFLNNISKRRR